MCTVVKNAYAKINLTLEILNKRPDGYHEIRSVMHKVSLHDTLTFEKRYDGKIGLACSKDVCAAEDNLAYKAAKLYFEKYKETTFDKFGINIHIEKNIPDCAGLAGGSSDCACVLDALREIFPGVPSEEIDKIASELGSDINFCLEKYKCAYVHGRGCDILKLPSAGNICTLISVPDCRMKTSEVYSSFDADPVFSEIKYSEYVKNCILNGENSKLFPMIYNSFSKVCQKKCEDISKIKEIMKQNFSFACEMSGSGSSVFGFFKSSKDRTEAGKKLENLGYKTFECETIA